MYRYSGCDRKELNDYEVFPEGKYDFYIESIAEAYTKKGAPVLEIVLKPSSHLMQKFGKVWHRIGLDSEWTRLNIGRLMAAVGYDPELPCDLHFSDFKGKHLSAKIKHKKVDGETFVNAFLLPLSESESNASPAAAATTNQGPDSRTAREELRRNDSRRTDNLAQEWDGASGRDDDIPF